MDRLSIVMLASALAGACDAKSNLPAEQPAGRTNGAKVNAGQAVSLDAFCDLHADEAKATAFRWPELAPGSSAPGAASAWRWVNVWATWCEPCVEELPRLTAWQKKLAGAGHKLELQFVSVDDGDAEVAAFQKAHAGQPPASIRVASADARASWLKQFNLSDGAIPIQLFVSPSGKLRCARAGGIRDKDYAVVEKLVSE